MLWEGWGITVYSYGVMAAMGFLVAYAMIRRQAVHAGVSKTDVDSICAALVIAGVVGGRAFYVVQHWDFFSAEPLEIVRIDHGGLVWYGAFWGGLAAAIVQARRKKLGVWTVLDLFLPFVAVGQGIGRIGCFLNGCCYGFETDGPLGIKAAGDIHARFPIQLVEAGLLWILAALLVIRWRCRAWAGQVACEYAIGYGVVRLLTEFGRGDQANVISFLDVPQVISVVMIVLGVTGWIWGRSTCQPKNG